MASMMKVYVSIFDLPVNKIKAAQEKYNLSIVALNYYVYIQLEDGTVDIYTVNFEKYH